MSVCISQDIKCSNKPFRGTNITAIGDLFQLQPVKDNLIFIDLKTNSGPLATNLWCEHFSIFELDEIMWKKDEKTFAELLNRLCIGKNTEDDVKLLNTHIVCANETAHINSIPHFFPTRKM